MSQGALAVASGSGAAVRAALNAALARLATQASGTARPSDIATGETWIETDNPGTGVWSWWLYDGASDILLGTINSSTHAITWSGGVSSVLTNQGDLLYRDGSGLARLAAGGDAFKALFTGGAGANPAWAGTWKVLGEQTPAGASSLAFTGIPSTVHHLMLLAELTVGTDGAALYARTYGADGVVDNGSSDYQSWGISFSTGGSTAAQFSGNASQMALLPGGVGVDSAASWGFSLAMSVANIQRATNTKVAGHSQYLDTAGASAVGMIFSGVRVEADRITGLQIYPNTGTITGRAVLLGMSN